MQTTLAVERIACGLAGSKKVLKLEDCKLRFQTVTSRAGTEPPTRDYGTALAKAAWLARMTMPVEGLE